MALLLCFVMMMTMVLVMTVKESERASEGAQRIDSSGSSRVVYHCFDGLLLGVKYCSFDFYD